MKDDLEELLKPDAWPSGRQLALIFLGALMFVALILNAFYPPKPSAVFPPSLLEAASLGSCRVLRFESPQGVRYFAVCKEGVVGLQ